MHGNSSPARNLCEIRVVRSSSFTLKYRRLRGDMNEVFKIIHNYYDTGASVKLNFNPVGKLRKGMCRYDIRKYSCCCRVVNIWNSLPLRRCVNLSRRQHLRNALFDALHQLSGTHYRKLFSVVTVAVFKLRLKTFLFSQAFSSFSAH